MNEIRLDVIDNFLSQEAHTKIKEYLESMDCPWSYVPHVAATWNTSDKEFYFEHLFFENFQIKSRAFELIIPLIEQIEPKALIRVKANLYPNLGSFVENGIHQDQEFPHKGAVYYVNTNNGYTGFPDGTKVESVANRLLMFESHNPHFSTHCTDQKIRLSINFNYF